MCRKRISSLIFAVATLVICTPLVSCTLHSVLVLPSSALEYPLPGIARNSPEAIPVWRPIRFSIPWNGGEMPHWERDAFIAGALVEPVLLRYQEKILLWRFHRRAARDATGHQFSWILYAPDPVIVEIFETLQSQVLTQHALQSEIIKGVRLDPAPEQARSSLAGMSDKAWPQDLQQAWPAFAMGSSLSWLSLLMLNADNTGASGAETLEHSLALWSNAHSKLLKVWQSKASHAYLHHLNAIFGYEPFSVGQETKRF